MIVSGFGGTRLKLEILYNGFKAINYPIKKRIATTIFVRWRVIIRLDQLIKNSWIILTQTLNLLNITLFIRVRP